jgi:HSP20 family molecular chaperone IbpA
MTRWDDPFRGLSTVHRIVLPNNADADHVQANFDNGTLRVMVPLTSQPEPKKISVGTGGNGKSSRH